ncbi:hypothetical protein [uncultured Pelagimonas sp.]|uniref:hypothetical protein n=1 Tax=uncultured Pelagimonas sp. TaxID=1618102 RepID=UPI00260B2DF7|nr:hypothetical protein [uncultured Pelagimonas sp.]
MRLMMLSVAALALVACGPKIPDSGAGVVDTGTGVGFGDYDNYDAQREAQLNGTAPATIPGPVDVQATPLDSAETDAAQRAASTNSGVAPVNASPANATPAVVRNSDGISGENDFDAVAAQRDIQADAALIAQNRAQYTLIAPTDLPKRPGSNAPNIVEYALRTDNPVGTSLYKRSSFRAEAKFNKACGAFASADLAQEAFLAQGGPQKDRKGMDPDGDGFACDWNPSPFRAVRGG